MEIQIFVRKKFSGFRRISGFRGEDLGFVGDSSFRGGFRAFAARVSAMFSWEEIRSGEAFGFSRREFGLSRGGLRILVGEIFKENFVFSWGGFEGKI